MAEGRARVVVCDDICGCPSPCPGATACRCVSAEDVASMEHKRCSCGEHCSCNPCTCSKSEVTATGRDFCKCAPGCTCTTCPA